MAEERRFRAETAFQRPFLYPPTTLEGPKFTVMSLSPNLQTRVSCFSNPGNKAALSFSNQVKSANWPHVTLLPVLRVQLAELEAALLVPVTPPVVEAQ
jgi:hypothetical protein